jgi:hypothetical protein
MSKTESTLRALTMAPPAILTTTSIMITSVSGNNVGVNYIGLPGNNPGAYSNFIAVVQATSPDFPFGATGRPVATFPVTGGVSGGVSIPADILINTAYVVGYAVGPLISAPATQQPYANICATAFIPASGSAYTSFTPSIILNDVQANSIACSYNLPPNCLPQTNGAWAGLWVGNNPSYGNPPNFFAKINSNESTGGPLIFNGVTINRGTLFSIGLFASGWVAGGVGSAQTAMAASIQFSS